MNWQRWKYSDMFIGAAIFIFTAFLMLGYLLFIRHQNFDPKGFFEWRVIMLFLFGLCYLTEGFRLKKSGKTAPTLLELAIKEKNFGALSFIIFIPILIIIMFIISFVYHSNL